MRKLRLWHTKTVVTPSIYLHVGALGHMAGDTLGPRRAHLVEMMRFGIKDLLVMAIDAQSVAVGPQFQAMRLMTVAATHAGGKHPALQK